MKPILGTIFVSIAVAATACRDDGLVTSSPASTGAGGSSSGSDASGAAEGGAWRGIDASSSGAGGQTRAGNDAATESVTPDASRGPDADSSEEDATDAAEGGARADGASVTASCAGDHPICIDFEDGKVDSPWALPQTNAKVEEGNAAHGRYAMHISNLHAIPKNGSGQPAIYLHAPMQGFKDVLWGRLYLYMDPGAPVGHGALVRANHMQTNWHEVGFESNAYFGDWHTGVVGNPEKYERSKDIIPKKTWACVEFYFDGATPALPKVWGDGAEVMFDDVGGPAQNLQKAVQFVSFDIGIVFYHGGSLVSYGDDTPPYITDEWIDDIALDTKRIGCL